MRIAFCQPALDPFLDAMRGESAEAACIQQSYIAAGLSARGHRLTYVAPRGLEDVEWAEGPSRARLAPRTWSASRWFDVASRGAWRMQRLLGIPYLNVFSNLRRFDAGLRCLAGHDLVHERNSLYSDGIARAARRLGLPYVMFFDADQIAEHDFMGRPITGLLRWRAGRLLRYNLRAARAVICVSGPAKQGLVERWGVPAGKIAVLPNGVDTQRFRPDPGSAAAVRAELGLGDGPLVIFVGNFYDWHDVETLLGAFAVVHATRPEARLLLVGDGPRREAMQLRSAQLGIAEAVHFTGLVTHARVPRLIAAADVAVAPVPAMAGESWLSPMKVYEYMAAGVAVVASGVGQLVSVIQDGQSGLLVPAGDIAAMSGAMRSLVEDRQLRARLAARARADVVAEHSWDRYVSRLEALYAAAAGGARVA